MSEGVVFANQSLPQAVVRLVMLSDGGRIRRPVRAGYLVVAAHLAELVLAGALVDADFTATAASDPRSASPQVRKVWERIALAPRRWDQLFWRDDVDVLAAFDGTVEDLTSTKVWSVHRRGPARFWRRYLDAEPAAVADTYEQLMDLSAPVGPRAAVLRGLLVVYGEGNGLVLESVLSLTAEPDPPLAASAADALVALTIGLLAALDQARTAPDSGAPATG